MIRELCLLIAASMALAFTAHPAAAHVQAERRSFDDYQLDRCKARASASDNVATASACQRLVWSVDPAVRKFASEAYAEAVNAINAERAANRRTISYVPDPYVVLGACPEEYCSYGVWIAGTSHTLYDKPNGTPTGAKLVRGERIAVLTGQLFVTPIRGEVQRDYGQFRRGETVYLLDYVGEGFSNILHRGQVTDNPMSSCSGTRCESLIRFEAGADHSSPCCPIAPQKWWISVYRRDGTSGWVRADAINGGFFRPMPWGLPEDVPADPFDNPNYVSAGESEPPTSGVAPQGGGEDSSVKWGVVTGDGQPDNAPLEAMSDGFRHPVGTPNSVLLTHDPSSSDDWNSGGVYGNGFGERYAWSSPTGGTHLGEDWNYDQGGNSELLPDSPRPC